MDISLIIPAFFAGILTFLAPCTLPLVPGYLGFISGVSFRDLEDPQKARVAKKIIVKNGISFILGFSVIFIIFGTLAGVVGQGLVPFRIWLTRIGGIFVIIFGLFMLGIIKIPFLLREKRFKAPSFLTIGKPTSSFVIGSAFAFGWTPCVGPVLGSILVLASTSTTVLQGAFLLAVFSFGLALPFLFVAFGFSRVTTYIKKISKYLRWISVIGGIFLIIIGLLLVTNNFSLLISYGFRLLDFIGYEELQKFL